MSSQKKIVEQVKPIKDDILEYCDEISKKDFGFSSGMVFVDYSEFEANKNKGLLQDVNNQSWGILNDEVKKMDLEMDRLLSLFKSFYTNKLDTSDYTPQQINQAINNHLIRIKRMVCVRNPEFTIIKSFDKKSNYHYDMIRGYWIDDSGMRIRNISRNVGNTEASIKDLIEKIIKLNSKNTIVYQPENTFGIQPDLIVSDGKSKWVVELKLQNKENFIRSFVMFEMWKMYKEKYALLD